jgi:flagellar biosynthetic protein FlhB
MLRLDLQLFSGEKTEKATPKKKQEARKKGQVAKSMDLQSSFLLLAAFLFLLVYSKQLGQSLLALFRRGFSDYVLWDLTADSVESLFLQLTVIAFKMTAPVLGLAFVAALLSVLGQVGFLVTTEPLKMDLKKINPIEGAKRIFSMRSVVELLKSIIKIIMIFFVSYFVIKKEIYTILRLGESDVYTFIQTMVSIVMKLGIILSALYVVISVLDYMYQRLDHEKNLRMSKQEVKDEHKKTEGDPLIKHKIKEKQRQFSMNRMIQSVPKADVIITNPTHYAVAIQYDANEMGAPTVIAKGVDYVAQRIKDVGKEHDIVVMENKPLARALYASVEVGEEIPEEMFKAVAEILAYVYRLKKKF